MSAIEKVLLPNFSGTSPRPVESRVVRPGPAIEVRHSTFKRETALGRDAFLQELRSAMSGFSRIVTAEFQVTRIDAGSMPSAALSPDQLQTRIRYALAATGRDFYREQRGGDWQPTAAPSATGNVQIQTLPSLDESR